MRLEPADPEGLPGISRGGLPAHGGTRTRALRSAGEGAAGTGRGPKTSAFGPRGGLALRAVVFANGVPPQGELAAEVCAAADFVAAADGGAGSALRLGIVPDLVVGDFDSLSKSDRTRLGAARLRHDPDPDRTDLQKAVELCIARGASEITILGASGGRADHFLANLSILVLYKGQARLTIVDERFSVSAVVHEERFSGPVGTVVSLLAVGECRGLTTRGLRWDLNDATLRFSPLGVHNEIERPPVTVRLEKGDLLLFLGRWTEKHE